jgi:hypothetical protein
MEYEISADVEYLELRWLLMSSIVLEMRVAFAEIKMNQVAGLNCSIPLNIFLSVEFCVLDLCLCAVD